MIKIKIYRKMGELGKWVRMGGSLNFLFIPLYMDLNNKIFLNLNEELIFLFKSF